MQRKSKLIAGAALAAAVAAAGTGVAVATSGGDDNEQPITGSELDKASRAALEHTGAGRVTETEVGDEESYYEVEVTLDDGNQVDVQLDRNFNVVGEKTEAPGTDDQDGQNEN